jgi:serine/threonine protein kinase
MFGWFGSKNDQAKPRKPAPPKRRKSNQSRRFTIVAETGQGSMSHVYRAVENGTGRVVCLKVQDAAKSAAASARSAGGKLDEGEVGMRIRHPHVVKTFEHGWTTKGEHFVVMEFIEGVSLTLLRQSRVLDLSEKLEFLAQAAEGLAAVHEAGFIHRDVGPKNLLVNRDDVVKLIDFGLAVPNTPEFHRPGNRTGTLNYMAPELLRREATDEKIDIFSFGVTMFEFFTGKIPYDMSITDPMSMMRQRINGTPTKLEAVAPHLPAELCELVNKTLAKRPKDRWESMATLPEALRELPVATRT